MFMMSVFDLRFGLMKAFFAEGDIGPFPLDAVVALLMLVALAVTIFRFGFRKLVL